MSLKNLKSLYDRHTYNSLGNTPENSSPRDGKYFTDKGTNDSPFITRGGGGDHMVDLLTKVVYSRNSNTSYNPSPNQNSNSDYQDLDGADGGQGYFQLERAAASKKHIDSLTKTSTYTHGNSTEVVGPVPGGADQNSPFNDIKGDIVKNTGPSFGDAGGEGKKLGGVDLHEALLTKSYTYNTDPGNPTTILLRKGRMRSNTGGKYDLDGNFGQTFHGGVQIGNTKTLHTDLLSEIYKSKTNPGASYGAGQPGGTWPSIKPGGLDLDGGYQPQNNLPGPNGMGQFGGPYKTSGPTDGFY
jgi:hypothetical protein